MKIKSLKLKKWSVVGSLIAFGGCSIFLLADKFIKELITSSKPDIQKQLGKQLGHPLLIGPYKGIRPWGIALGSTRLFEGDRDTSKAVSGQLKIQFAPIATLFARKPVIILSPNDLELYLNSNENGSFWVLGPTGKGEIPNLVLKVRLNKTSNIYLDSVHAKINRKSVISLLLAKKKLKTSISIALPNNGSFNFKGTGYWDRLSVRGRLRFRKFNLKSLQAQLFNKFDISAKGKINSNIYIGIKESDISCRGRLSFDDLYVGRIGQLQDQELFARRMAIKCRDNYFTVPKSQFEFGPWVGNIGVNMALGKKYSYELNLLSSISSKDQISSPLNLDASLPLQIFDNGISFGPLFAQVDLKDFALSSLSPIIGQPLSGNITTNGTISGPFSNLKSNVSIELDNPQISKLRLQEKWTGKFISSSDGLGELSMSSVAPAVPGTLNAIIENWSLKQLLAERLGGTISLDQISGGYNWQAKNFRLDRIEVSLPPENSFKRTFGKLIGKGTFKTSPFSLNGQITYRFPRLFGVRFKEAKLSGAYSERNYSLLGEIIPPDRGSIIVNADGLLGGTVKAKATVKGVSPSWLVDSGLKLSKLNLIPEFALETAGILEPVSLYSPKESLDSQLKNSDISRVFVERYKRTTSNKQLINPSNLQGNISGEAYLEGKKLPDFKLNVNASGKIWIKGDRRNGVDIKPFTATFKSSSFKDNGEFSLLNLPISIFSLFFATPSSLSGMFGFTGKYNFKGKSPELDIELVLNEARIAQKEFILEEGKFFIANSLLQTDLSLRESSSRETLLISGQVPLSSKLPFDLKIESHGDGISFLDGLSDGLVTWKSGNANLKLLIRGTYDNPIANGFLAVSEGKFLVNDKLVDNFESQIIFDFNQVEVQKLRANVAKSGEIKAKGEIALFSSENNTNQNLYVEMNSIEVNPMTSNFNLSSKLNIKRSLIRPLIGGDITVQKGSISTKTSRPNKRDNSKVSISTYRSNQPIYKTYPEQNWDYKAPLLLFIQDKGSTASRILGSTFPKSLSSITFDSLRLRLGPDLRIVSQPIATFNTSGLLILNGPLDERLELRGVMRLEKGRVNLFTTTFDLDRSEPNIALFAPSMGLIPYLDITMTSRIPDVVQETGEVDSSSDLTRNSSGIVGIGGSRLIKVELIATGPADRVSDSFQLRSTPSLPKSQLLNLIGGNSLTMLASGSEQEVLVGLLNRSFLSPVLGNLGDAFNDRIQFSLYPAYVSPKDIANEESKEDDESELDNATKSETPSENLSPQQAWIAEVGLDLSERINFSIQTTPSRDDIPPQGTLTYQFNPNIGILGALDTNGDWQSQMQLFIRY